MTKRLCDICGKEIIGLRDRYSVSIDNDYAQAKCFKVVNDVCTYCASSIYHYIEGLKKPLDKSTES